MKSKRHNKIIELIRDNDIGTQEELAEALNKEGFLVTQATVSRDIRELKLTKTSVDGKRQKYVIYQSQDTALNQKYIKIIKEGLISMEVAVNLLVIKTVSGMAGAVCVALDSMNYAEIVGTIAGDDTIMVATMSQEKALSLMERLNYTLKSEEG